MQVSQINNYFRTIEAASEKNIAPLLGPHVKSVFQGLIFSGNEYIKI